VSTNSPIIGSTIPYKRIIEKAVGGGVDEKKIMDDPILRTYRRTVRDFDSVKRRRKTAKVNR